MKFFLYGNPFPVCKIHRNLNFEWVRGLKCFYWSIVKSCQVSCFYPSNSTKLAVFFTNSPHYSYRDIRSHGSLQTQTALLSRLFSRVFFNSRGHFFNFYILTWSLIHKIKQKLASWNIFSNLPEVLHYSCCQKIIINKNNKNWIQVGLT